MKYIVPIVVILLCCVGCSLEKKGNLPLTTSRAVVTEDSKQCLECHTKKTPAIVASWRESDHAEASVGCYECHSAEDGEIDALDHFGNTVAVIVSPKDCGVCHSVETEQFLGSHHAKGGEVLGSLDNYLGEVVEGFGASVSGCQQCHGSIVEITDEGKFTAATWPNFGIGRVNPDGSAGSCSSCHSRHDFSIAQARSPETCGRCHLGPDHPQKEVYDESKHNIAYRSHIDEMNMDSASWVVGVDYSAAPTCATCHVSATPNQPKTHNIGLRLSWNIRAPVSFKTEDSDDKRKAMQEVCFNCHSPNYVENFYVQYDAGINLYNTKFAIPSKDIIDQLKEADKLDTTPFNEPLDWIYFYLWHHEGRRARNGIAMMGPDYVQWHGFYDIAERFYMELIPEAEHLMPGITGEILARPEHKWFTTELTPEEREEISNY
ncbi:MAG: hypothetical protein KAQ69_11750 [Spirochaetales bacterium]|nr:hypothetical protein [Spirochaetales bacterium]